MADVNANKVFTFYQEVPMSDSMKALISEKEKIVFAVKTMRDLAVFTDKRILIAEKQGITGKKAEYYTIPYKSIVTYAVENSGTLDFDSELKLTLLGGITAQLRFMDSRNKNQMLIKVYHLINEFMVN
ncbi:MAG TPA: hypothetical protein DGK91_03735, partial [Clostridium sp.]|jgi:hypothetical protein|nr:PH domain-containing protein [Clostridia bacterium]HCW03717.1 hypothetical protein [Clostridium sp.]